MTWWLNLLIVAAAFCGHVFFWAAMFNRAHATAFPEWLVKLLSLACHAASASIALAVAVWLAEGGSLLRDAEELTAWGGVRWAYVLACGVVLAGPFARWAHYRLADPTCPAVSAHARTELDIAALRSGLRVSGWKARALACVPGNEVLRLVVETKEILLPRLAAPLDGLSIVHLADLHFCGRIPLGYFEEVVAQTNALAGDLVVVTGDVLDDGSCLPWIDTTLARLRAGHGAYFILGNHDLFAGRAAEIRARLAAVGWCDVGGRWLETAIRGQRVILAGNELPWFAPAADMRAAPPRGVTGEQLRIALCHSPDQIAWATRWDFDLALAGHTHGGQIRLPWIGPVFVPSRLPVRFSAGTFWLPPTVLHVTRGVSAKTPIRLNCPPELTKLVLRRGGA